MNSIIILKRINEEHNELLAHSKPFQFEDNTIPEFNCGDQEQDEYHSYIFDELTKHKQDAFQHWQQFQQLWLKLDDEDKNNNLCNVSHQRSLLQTVFAT